MCSLERARGLGALRISRVRSPKEMLDPAGQLARASHPLLVVVVVPRGVAG